MLAGGILLRTQPVQDIADSGEGAVALRRVAHLCPLTSAYFASPKHLWRRARGEECLVAAAGVDRSGATCTRRYRTSMVEVNE